MRIKQICVVMLILFASIAIEMRAVWAQVAPQPPKPSAPIPLEMIGDPGGGAPSPTATPPANSAIPGKINSVYPSQQGSNLRGPGVNSRLSQLRNPFDGGHGEQPVHNHAAPSGRSTSMPTRHRKSRTITVWVVARRWASFATPSMVGPARRRRDVSTMRPPVQHRARFGSSTRRCLGTRCHVRSADAGHYCRGSGPRRTNAGHYCRGSGRRRTNAGHYCRGRDPGHANSARSWRNRTGARRVRMRSVRQRRLRVQVTAVHSRRPSHHSP